jgi:O-antigen ligase/polysaccharide polymerase Wzy-like membrane protein
VELRHPGPKAVAAALAAGPALLAFWAGGYFEGPRLVAAIVAWACVVVLAIARRPQRPAARTLAAVGGLALLVAWVAASLHAAPLRDAAGADLQRDALYLGALIAAVLAVRDRATLRALEPALAVAILVVAAYGLAGRLLPGIAHEHFATSAGGRLDQPLTYWNAMGALAAIGVVLWARIAADRPAAVAAIAPLGLAVYMTYSRGALGALAAGLVVLVLLAPTWEQLRAVIVGAEGAAIAAIAASRLGDLKTAQPTSGEGAVLLAVLVAAMLLAVVLHRRGATGPLGLAPRARTAGWVVAIALAAAPFAVAVASERGTPTTPAFGAGAARLGSVGSNRYAYWRVAVHTWADHPLDGAGPASFRVEWLKRRPFVETVRDAHSLELETLAELGLVGFGCLALLFGGVIAALRRIGAPAIAGPAAALAVWAVHSGIDWDWEMPALTLVAIVLAGAALGAATPEAASPPDREPLTGDPRSRPAGSGQRDGREDAERRLGGEAEAGRAVGDEGDRDDEGDGREQDQQLPPPAPQAHGAGQR